MAATPHDEQDDDDRFRPPPRGTHAGRPTNEADLNASLPTGPLREGDDEDLGRPVVVTPLQRLSAADRQRLASEEAAAQAAARAEADELLASDPAAFRWLGWISGPLAGSVLIGFVGLFGLYVYAQSIAILAHIASQPIWAQYLGYAGLGLLVAAVLYAMLRLLGLFLKLQRNKQLRLAGLQELQARTRLRHLAACRVAEARDGLIQYIKSYPMATAAEARRLQRLGMTPEALARLIQAKTDLTNPNLHAGSVAWFEDFRDRFQTELDQIAQERIHYWGNRALVVTAASPNSLIDSAATLFFSVSLLQDLCTIYHLRVGRTGTLVFLGRVFTNAYLAGQVNDLEGLLEQQADHVFDQAFHMAGVGVGSSLASKFLGKVGAKATTGYLNRLLLLRLGKYTCKLLRPVAG